MTCIYNLKRFAEEKAQQEYAAIKKFQSDAEEVSRRLRRISKESHSIGIQDLGVEPFE